MSRTTSAWRKVRALAWDRDRKNKAICHLCGQPIDYTLEPSSCSEAWEPDHVMTFKEHPELELDLNNVLASHRRCNRARGMKDDELIGQHSRIW